MCAEKLLTVSTPGVLWLELCSLLSAERMCACPAARKSSCTRAQCMEVVVETLSSLVPCVPRTVACPRKLPYLLDLHGSPDDSAEWVPSCLQSWPPETLPLQSSSHNRDCSQSTQVASFTPSSTDTSSFQCLCSSCCLSQEDRYRINPG